MAKGRNGKNGRVFDLNAAAGGVYRQNPVGITPDVARALIDRVFRSYGLDPGACTNPHGWRHLEVGSATGVAGVIEWQPGVYYLIVSAPVLKLPQDTRDLGDFFRLLLELNHHGTLGARLSVHEDTVFVSLARPIGGLDAEEVDAAIRSVMTVADGYDDWLTNQRDLALAKALPERTELPQIPMTPQAAGAIGAVLAACDPHGQGVFRDLMQRWSRAGHVVEPGTSGIGLKFSLGRELYSVAGIRPGVGARRQLIILGWEGLRKLKVFPDEAVDRFQVAVSRIVAAKVTESTAHIEVTEDFDANCTTALLRAMYALVKTAHPPEQEIFEWDSSVPRPAIQVGPQTLEGIYATLQMCAPLVQQMYIELMEGWHAAGGTVQCSRPGRVYLKLHSREHAVRNMGKLSHTFNLAAPKGKRGACIEVAWNLAQGEWAYLDYAAEHVACFEAAVAALPGFERKGTVTRLLLDGGFETAHARALLEAMVALKDVAGG